MKNRMFRVTGCNFVCAMSIIVFLLYAPCSLAYEKEIKTISATMAENIAKSGKKRVAVVDFTDLEGNVTALGRFIAEEFSVALLSAGKGFEIVDRTHLQSILREHKLSTTGLIDPETARKLGQIAGVEALITGTITPFGESVRLSAKILDASTAKLIGANTGNIPKTKAIEELLGKGIVTGGITPTETKAATPVPSEKGVEFFDDFDKGPNPVWKPISGDWTMANGMYTVATIEKDTWYKTFVEDNTWTNFVLTVDVKPGNEGRDWCNAWIFPRISSDDSGVGLWIGGKNGRIQEVGWKIGKKGEWGQTVGRVQKETSEGQLVNIEIEVKDNVFTAYLDGVKLSQLYDTTLSSGSVGLGQWYDYWDGPHIRVAFDNLKITTLK